jgi:hypothetical protein
LARAGAAAIPLVAGVLIAVPSGATAQAAGQYATAPAGTLAQGYIVAPFEIGHDIEVDVVEPAGATGSPSAGTLDVTSSFAWVAVVDGIYVGHKTYCSTLSNLAVSGNYESDSMSTVVNCDDGLYHSYSVTWRRTSPSYSEPWGGRPTSGSFTTSTESATYGAVASAFFTGTLTVCTLVNGVATQCMSTPDPSVGYQPGEDWGDMGVESIGSVVMTATSM